MANLDKNSRGAEGVRKAEFSLGRLPKGGQEVTSFRKTSFMAPESLMQRFRVLAARTGKKQGELITEALEDLLSKYGQ